ncbi:MAG: 3-hydroxyacyl-CoA dehydrogenase NAD-binding domain-containing protein [Spirosomaceae bacterium]|nr:3-hydroxyacyl-CoA dehydrogenase NAD-binding domain-containing protein [Spirosomataceae bacterium]
MEFIYKVENQVAIISWNMTTSPMNVLNSISVPEFQSHLQKAYDDENVKGIIITSEKNEFVAGADVKQILKYNDASLKDIYDFSMELNNIFRKLETCGKPVVAAINGTALGGGFEICLACHYRIALNNPKAQIGLPESQLGLLPGAGGTQRLPRLIGIQNALLLIAEGKRVSPQEALGYGMVHDIASTKEELIEKATKWIAANPRAIQPWDEFNKKTGAIQAKENYKVPNGNVQSPVGVQVFNGGTAMLMDKTKGNYPAQLEILSCVYEGLQVNIDQGIKIEARHFAKVVKSKEAQNLIGVMFLGKNEVDKGARRPKNIPLTDVKKLGILGAGFMGSGIAYVSAMAGIEVVLKDVSLESAEKGKDYSRNLIKKGIEKGKTTAEKGDILLNLIKTTDKAEDLQGCDLIIEAVFENRELKATVTKEAEPMLNESGVFGSNTSTLPISGLAKASSKPENFIGIHFFSPVDKMMLVEIIMGKETSDYALALTIDYVKKIRKTPIVVNDSRGFYTSRCFGTYTTEGIALLKDGVAPILIENAGKYAGMPVGALAVSDEVALDLALKISKQSIADGALSEEDGAYKVTRMMVEDLGRLGKKNKKGFYEYPEDDSPKKLWDGLSTHFPVAENQPSLEEVKNRLLYRQVVEAIRCWDEGVITNKLDANLGSILAWGFPPYAGGTLNFPDFVGKEKFISETDRLADTYGERFRLTEQQKEKVKNL